ncbi:AraC family transcriptional regulator [Thermophilibacter sp.]
MANHELEFSTFPSGQFIDLMPIQYGRERCEPGHAFGPARRSHYLFHYVIAGRGTLMAEDDAGGRTDHHVMGGEGFLIFPDQVNTYVADLADPWEYVWVEFEGLRVKESLELVGLTRSAPIYRARSTELRDQMAEQMRFLVTHRDASPLELVGHTFLFLDLLLRSVEQPAESERRQADLHVQAAVEFIKQHYGDDVSVEDIARHAGLNRSYFGKVFKAATGRSPQQYLIGYRMTKAAELLKVTTLSVGEVGRAVGYPNQLHFSRAFKGVHGMSPRAWRQLSAAAQLPNS